MISMRPLEHSEKILKDATRVCAFSPLSTRAERSRKVLAAALSEKSEKHGWNSNTPQRGVSREGGGQGHLRPPKSQLNVTCFRGKGASSSSSDGSARDNRRQDDASVHVSGRQKVEQGEGMECYPVMMISG